MKILSGSLQEELDSLSRTKARPSIEHVRAPQPAINERKRKTNTDGISNIKGCSSVGDEGYR